MAAVAAELVSRGHEVVAYTGAKYHTRFKAIGATWLPWTRAQDFDDAEMAATFPEMAGGKRSRGAMSTTKLVLFGTAAGQAADIRVAASQTPFDLMVADQLAFGAALASESLDRPWVTVSPTLLALTSRDLPPFGFRLRPATGPLGRLRDAMMRRLVQAAYRKIINPHVDRIRATVELPPTTITGMDSLFSPYLVLTQGVFGFDYPRNDLPAHVHYVGRLAQPPNGQPELPPWWPELTTARAQGRPVIYVTQGTLDTNPDELLRPTIAALADLDLLLVCSTGGLPCEVLGPLPPNVRAARFVPYDALLPQLDLVVTNGGLGAVLTAIEAGVPLVVAGGPIDKPEVARRVAWSGVGLDLRTGAPRSHQVRQAVNRVLQEPRLRQRSREIGAALTAAGGAPAAATLIENLLTRSGIPAAGGPSGPRPPVR
ncbi:MAG: glycosyltransferase [Micromonosporaceae bacterium]